MIIALADRGVLKTGVNRPSHLLVVSVFSDHVLSSRKAFKLDVVDWELLHL